MRVAMNLLWCRPGVGGSEEYLVRQLDGLREAGHPVDVEVFAPREFSERLPMVAAHFTVHEAPSTCVRRAERVALEHTWLASRTRGFDLVHHGGGTVPRVGNGRTLLTVHDVQWVDYPHYVRAVKRRYLQWMVPRSLRRATRVAVPSRFVSGTLVDAFGADPRRIGVVRHGLEAHMDAPTPESELRNRLGIGQRRVVVYPAITHPHKNHAFLLELMSRAGTAWSSDDLVAVFAGSAGNAEASVREGIARFGLTHRVVMPGRVSGADRNGLLAFADAMVFPSEYEGFGAPLIEAMRIGTPVIASDRASIPEVLGECGLVRSLRIDDWTGTLDEARARRSELVAAGRARASEFTSAKSAADLVEEYRRVMR
jgi:alpha-1,3-rhamnosyl/mannosyltransferase